VTYVLDASALLALLYREPGHDRVADLLDGAVISSVNWSETLAKLAQRGLVDRAAVEALLALGVEVVPFGRTDAERAARLWPAGRACGLSLGDRACLAVAQARSEGIAVTADKVWADLDIPDVTVELIR
jgi:PIN domain nuclease of toxin-antitoxin system